jgi:hypothetical protein
MTYYKNISAATHNKKKNINKKIVKLRNLYINAKDALNNPSFLENHAKLNNHLFKDTDKLKEYYINNIKRYEDYLLFATKWASKFGFELKGGILHIKII